MNLTFRSLGWVIASFLWLAPPMTAAAQDLDAQARTHFESGRAYFDTADYESAIREFNRAYELSQRAGLLLNISAAYERLGELGPAIDAIERFLRAEPNSPERATLELRAQRLRQRLAERGPVAEAAPVVETPAPSSGGDDLVVGGAIAYGFAGAGLAVMAIFGGLAMGEDAAVSSECGADAGRTCSDARLSTLFAFTVAADVGLAVAATGAAIGTLLVILGASSSSSEVAVAPWVTPNALGVSAGGRF